VSACRGDDVRVWSLADTRLCLGDRWCDRGAHGCSCFKSWGTTRKPDCTQTPVSPTNSPMTRPSYKPTFMPLPDKVLSCQCARSQVSYAIIAFFVLFAHFCLATLLCCLLVLLRDVICLWSYGRSRSFITLKALFLISSAGTQVALLATCAFNIAYASGYSGIRRLVRTPMSDDHKGSRWSTQLICKFCHLA
jgi:hypothetical protein